MLFIAKLCLKISFNVCYIFCDQLLRFACEPIRQRDFGNAVVIFFSHKREKICQNVLESN